MSKVAIAATTMIGSIIGAGVLGLPYVLSQSGLTSGMIHLFGIGLLLLIVNLALGEIILRTKGNHQLSGYTGKYLGKWGKHIIAGAILIQLYGALIAYIIGEGTSFSSLLGGSSVVYSLLFFVVMSFLAHKGLKAVGWSEFFLIVGLGIIVILVSLMGIPHMEHTIPNVGEQPLMPFGIVLFALYGISSIPLVKEFLTRDRKHMRSAIIIGSLVPIVIYATFSFVVASIVGVDGFNALGADDRIASAALQSTIDGVLSIMTLLFGIVAMMTSFLVGLIVVKEVFVYDYKMNKHAAFYLAILPPLGVFLLDAFVVDIANFISVLGFTGAIGGSLTAILILLTYFKARKHGDRTPEYSMDFTHIVVWILMAVFATGSIIQIASLF